MKSWLGLCVLVALSVLGGCAQSTAPQAAAEPVETTPAPPPGVNLVKLKLPGMVCGGCAMEVKDELTKVPGVSHIATNPAKHECTFWFEKDQTEIKAKLDELAKSNDKIAGYEFLN